ncbi:hypothetical protein HPC49_35215, partial [Pyxidicoccus fallax]
MSDIRVVFLVLALLPARVLAQSSELAPPPLIEAAQESESVGPSVPEVARPPRVVTEAEWGPEPR